jgi:hypothetical protein
VERMLAGMAILLAALLLVGMGVLVFGDVGEESIRTGGDGAGGLRADNELDGCGRAPEPPTSQVRADEGRYAVEVPQGWDGAARGSVVTLWDRGGRARLAVGLAPAGGLTSALDDLRSNLGRSYRGLHVTGLSQLEVGGCPAQSIVGRALNRDGVRLSFEGMVVAGPENNYALAGFVVRGAERSDDLNRAIRSIRSPAPEGN